ncbi:MAG: cyclase family protein [Oscillospiraceae bacterium]|nr:cyclase family protein [Oscillospiraceae bacterium]
MLQYKEIIDLTMPVFTGMSIPPANRENSPKVIVENRIDINEKGINVSYYQQGIHAGTHLDSPLHIIKGGTPIDEVPLEHFMGPGYCIDCTEVKPNKPVTAAMLDKAAGKITQKGMIVLLYTGWSDRMFGTDDYWMQSPYLGEDAAQWLVDKGAKIAGFDFFQDLGAKNSELHPENFHVHRILLGNGCLNIEHLVNLGAVVDTYFDVIALPLRLRGVEGSPSRVIALR